MKHLTPKRRRVLIIVASVAALMLLLVGYSLWSMTTWNAYRTSYENWQKELRTGVDAAIVLPVTTSAERAKKKTAFKDTSNKINSAQQSLCQVSGIVAWQHAVGDFRQREEACRQIVGQADTFGKKIQETTIYLEHEQTLAAAIAAALKTSEGKVTEATWGSQVETWQTAEKTITKIPSPEALFIPVKTSALEKIKAIETAWGEVIAAHTAKDKAKYTEAQAKLATAYEALPSLAATSTQQLTVVTQSLQLAYVQLFGSKI